MCSSTDDSSLLVKSTLIIRHVTKPGLGRGRSAAGGFAFALVVLLDPAAFERINTSANMDQRN